MGIFKHGVWDASDCALLLIDYQPEMFRAVRSAGHDEIERNVCALARAATAFRIPVVLSTVGVGMGVNQPTVEVLRRELPGVKEIDRSSMNAWEDEGFLRAVHATGKKRLVMCGLWTEICLVFPAVDALATGFEVTFVVDAVGGESPLEHDTAVRRLVHAGAVPNSTLAMVAEWFRDWKAPNASAGREVLISLWRERARLEKQAS